MHELGLEVANVAARDLQLGPEAFARFRDELPVDFVSANILVDGEPLVERFRVYERRLDGRTVRIGVTGVTSSSRAALELWKDAGVLEVADPVESAREVLEAMRSTTDVQVLLAHLPARVMEELVSGPADGYDVLISGLGRLVETTPVGPTPAVLWPGTRAKHLAWVNLTQSQNAWSIVGGEVLGLDEKVQDDPQTAQRVLELKERLAAATAERRVSAHEGAEESPVPSPEVPAPTP